jgi:hypothetical protein
LTSSGLDRQEGPQGVRAAFFLRRFLHGAAFLKS